MAEEDRERWNRKHGAAGPGFGRVSAALTELSQWLPTVGAALDVAGGAGASAVWLAQRGLSVTMVDVSDVGLARATEHARHRGVVLQVEPRDLECEPLPPGPWDLVLCSFYLQRALVPCMAATLAPGGRLVWIHPTTTNLERHASPSARFLLDPGEARVLVEAAGLEVRWYEEAWVGEGDAARHLARVVAQAAMG